VASAAFFFFGMELLRIGSSSVTVFACVSPHRRAVVHLMRQHYGPVLHMEPRVETHECNPRNIDCIIQNKVCDVACLPYNLCCCWLVTTISKGSFGQCWRHWTSRREAQQFFRTVPPKLRPEHYRSWRVLDCWLVGCRRRPHK